jgi:D-glycero-D-manno-heptose 1,7-bisphosphate phosphatase
MRPAIFFDRDGVLIENCAAYVRAWEDVVPIPGAREALASAAGWPHALFIVSNQAGVGKGILSIETAEAINNGVAALMSAGGGRIDRAYLCPHRPEDACDCRKPRPGMLWRAAREFDIDLAASWMIGDNITDMQAARAVGARSILVLTGLGNAQLRTFADAHWFTIADNVADALAFIARNDTHN